MARSQSQESRVKSRNSHQLSTLDSRLLTLDYLTLDYVVTGAGVGDGDGAVDDEPPQAIANKRNAETTTRRNDDIEPSENRRWATEITIDTTPPLVAAVS